MRAITCYHCPSRPRQLIFPMSWMGVRDMLPPACIARRYGAAENVAGCSCRAMGEAINARMRGRAGQSGRRDLWPGATGKQRQRSNNVKSSADVCGRCDSITGMMGIGFRRRSHYAPRRTGTPPRTARWRREYMVSGLARVTALFLMLGAPALAQPCNPVIDGTYCAENMSRQGVSRSRPTFAPVESIGSDILVGQDSDPATFGAITFRGNGTRCIGLLRRGACS